jgi:Family of unknown function (DUF6152)
MRIGLCVIAVLLAVTSALAHHSNSAFDGDKVVVLTGTVTEWKWTNPHVWIFLSVHMNGEFNAIVRTCKTSST